MPVSPRVLCGHEALVNPASWRDIGRSLDMRDPRPNEPTSRADEPGHANWHVRPMIPDLLTTAADMTTSLGPTFRGASHEYQRRRRDPRRHAQQGPASHELVKGRTDGQWDTASGPQLDQVTAGRTTVSSRRSLPGSCFCWLTRSTTVTPCWRPPPGPRGVSDGPSPSSGPRAPLPEAVDVLTAAFRGL